MLEKIQNLIYNAKKILFNLEEDEVFPYRFAIVRVNDAAKTHGIDDDENKEIVLYEGGEVKKIMPFTKAHLKYLKDDGIPTASEIDDAEEFEFDAYSDFGLLKYKK